LLPVSQGISVPQKKEVPFVDDDQSAREGMVDLVTVAVALSLNAVSRSHEPIQPDADAPAVRFSRGGAVSLIWIIAGPFRCCRLR
jgi:hypothetical protein